MRLMHSLCEAFVTAQEQLAFEMGVRNAASLVSKGIFRHAEDSLPTRCGYFSENPPAAVTIWKEVH